MTQKVRKIAYAEPFDIYIYVDFKQAPIIKRKLEKAGYKCKLKEQKRNDDFKVTVRLTPVQAHEVVKIFNEFK